MSVDWSKLGSGGGRGASFPSQACKKNHFGRQKRRQKRWNDIAVNCRVPLPPSMLAISRLHLYCVCRSKCLSQILQCLQGQMNHAAQQTAACCRWQQRPPGSQTRAQKFAGARAGLRLPVQTYIRGLNAWHDNYPKNNSQPIKTWLGASLCRWQLR